MSKQEAVYLPILESSFGIQASYLAARQPLGLSMVDSGVVWKLRGSEKVWDNDRFLWVAVVRERMKNILEAEEKAVECNTGQHGQYQDIMIYPTTCVKNCINMFPIKNQGKASLDSWFNWFPECQVTWNNCILTSCNIQMAMFGSSNQNMCLLIPSTAYTVTSLTLSLCHSLNLWISSLQTHTATKSRDLTFNNDLEKHGFGRHRICNFQCGQRSRVAVFRTLTVADRVLPTRLGVGNSAGTAPCLLYTYTWVPCQRAWPAAVFWDLLIYPVELPDERRWNATGTTSATTSTTTRVCGAGDRRWGMSDQSKDPQKNLHKIQKPENVFSKKKNQLCCVLHLDLE